MYKFILKNKKKIIFSIFGIMLFSLFQKMCQWDLAEEELSYYPNTISVLISYKSKYQSTLISRTQTYIVIPYNFDFAFTVTIESNEGVITVDEDKYGVFKILFFMFIIIPFFNLLFIKYNLNKNPLKN